MKQNRNSTISGQDIYITHRCQVSRGNNAVPFTCRGLYLFFLGVALPLSRPTIMTFANAP